MKSTALVIIAYVAIFVTNCLAQNSTDQPTEAVTTALPDTSSSVSGRNDNFNIAGSSDSQFLIPNQISNNADVFARGSMEYVVISTKLKYRQVRSTCQENYNGILAVVNNRKIADFLAEALLETNLELDSLWIGAEHQDVEGVEYWYWTSHGHKELMNRTLFNNLLVKHINGPPTAKRNCLAFGRYRDQPQFRPLDCSGMRSFICQRRKMGGIGEGNSTHTGWIKKANKLYKIYYDAVPWEKAARLCSKKNVNAVLAVVPNSVVSELLGRFLLIGRPSLENAWIGGRFDKSVNGYKFESESVVLPNVSNKDSYPPWKRGAISRRSGCILLDRHLANKTLFVEARCERLRSYICSIDSADIEGGIHFVDIFLDGRGYRLYLDARAWDEAYEICASYSKFGGKLVEIRSKATLKHLLYIMGEVRKDMRHLWVGGKYDGTKWVWATSKSDVNKSILQLVNNRTYIEEAEATNICLNMDREFHKNMIHYGTECSWRQNFVCDFTKSELKRLIKETQNGTVIKT